MRYALFILAAILLALTPTAALAADPRSGSNVTIDRNEVINDDLYVTGGTLNIMGTVNGDVVAAGGTVDVSGSVTGDVIAAGGTINISGQVGESVRATGGTVTVSGPVEGDVLSGAGNLTLSSGSRVGRDLLVGAGSATLNGQVTRNVISGSGDLTVNGPVGGDIQAQGGNIRLADGATVAGNLIYTSDQTPSIASGARVQGQIVQQPSAQATTNPLLSRTIGWLQAVVGLFFLGLLFVLLFPRFSRHTAASLISRPWQSLGLGFVVLVVVPILAAVVFFLGIFIGGWWLGAMALALYGIAVVLSIPVAGLSIGRWVLDRSARGRIHPIWAMLLGVVVLMLVSQLPIVGGIALFLAILFGLGALAVAATQEPQAPQAVLRPAPVIGQSREDTAA